MAQTKSNFQPINRAKILVTGGSGFIGRAVCRLLIRSGADVLNYDRRPWPGPDIGPLTIIGDIENRSEVTGAYKRHDPTIVIHLAAFASVTAKSRKDFSSIWNGTRVIADAFSAANHPARMLNVSTQLVIGPGPQPKDLRSYAPYTPYGDAKAEAEIYLDNQSYPFEVIHFRPANIWGPHHPSYAASIMRYLERGWYLHPILPKPVLRTYGFVENCAAQIISAAFSNNLQGRTILYGGDEVLDSFDFLNAMSLKLRNAPVRTFPILPLRFVASTGSFIHKLSLPFPLDRERLRRMSTSYAVPLSPMKSVMIFPPLSFDDGLSQTISWYKKGAKSNWIDDITSTTFQ